MRLLILVGVMMEVMWVEVARCLLGRGVRRVGDSNCLESGHVSEKDLQGQRSIPEVKGSVSTDSVRLTTVN